MNETHTEQTLQVEGMTWEGFNSEYTYPITDNAPATLRDAKLIAGDFQSLTQAKIVTSTTTIQQTHVAILA